MGGSTASEAPAWPAAGPLHGRAAFAAALRGLVAGAGSRSVRRLRWVSVDPGLWPWEDANLLDDLSRWVREPGRSFQWIGPQFEQLRSAAPRLTRWRATWDHRLQCLAPEETEVLQGRECLLVDGQGCLEWLDARQGRARFEVTPAQLLRTDQWFDAVLQRCHVTFPVTTLGI